MNKAGHLRKSSDFERVFRTGRSWANNLLVLYAAPNALTHNRYGFAASKRVGNAVMRNRAKRLMRETIRHRQQEMKLGWDLVLIARRQTPQSNYGEVDDALVRLLRQAGLLLVHQ